MKLDLNLLVVFDAVARFGSVTAAADHLALSQSAVSHALSRLRTAIDDPLFTRSGRGLVATPRALAMVGPARNVLLNATQLLSPVTFNPKLERRTFRIGASDYAALTLVPNLIKLVQKTAPNVTLEIVGAGKNTLQQLEEGTLDASFWGTLRPDKPYHHHVLFDEHYVGVARSTHPYFKKDKSNQFTLAQYINASHAVVSLGDPGANQVDEILNGMGKSRNIGLKSNSFISNMACLTLSNLIATLPCKLSQSTLMVGLRVFRLPFEVPTYTYGLVWHHRTNLAPGHIWLRNMICELG